MTTNCCKRCAGSGIEPPKKKNRVPYKRTKLLSCEEKNDKIIALYYKGLSHRNIAKQLAISKFTVSRYLKKNELRRNNRSSGFKKIEGVWIYQDQGQSKC